MNRNDQGEGPRSPAATLSQRTCKADGCGAKLVHNNTSGYCQKHAVPRTNFKAKAGDRPASSGTTNDPELAKVQRVNLVLAAMPQEDKARMVVEWLSGRF